MDEDFVCVTGKLVRGYGVAGGGATDSPYPAGSIALQTPHFLERGVDLRPFHPATLNVDLAPWAFSPVRVLATLECVRWTQLAPEETFSFAPCRIECAGKQTAALVYWPHPETKPAHFQQRTIVELLAIYIEGATPGAECRVWLHPDNLHRA